MFKINLLFLYLFPFSLGYPINEKFVVPDEFQSALLEPFINKALTYARPDSDLIYLNVAVMLTPMKLHIFSYDDKRHVSVYFDTSDAQWTSFCKQENVERIRIEPFHAGGHTLDIDIYCEQPEEVQKSWLLEY